MNLSDITFSDIIFRCIPNLQPEQEYTMTFGVFSPLTFKVISMQLSKGMGETWDEACPIATISYMKDGAKQIESINLNKYDNVRFIDSEGRVVNTVTNISYFKLSDYGKGMNMVMDMRNDKSDVVFRFVSEDRMLVFSEILSDSEGLSIKSDYKPR